MEELKTKTEAIPVVALRGLTVFPHLIIHFDLNRKKSIEAIECAMTKDQQILLVTQRDAQTLEPAEQDLYPVGTIATIRQITKLPGKVLRVMVEGNYRARVLGLTEETEYLEADYELIPDEEEPESPEREACLSHIRELVALYGQYYPKVAKAFGMRMDEIHTLGRGIDQAVMNMPVDYRKKQEILQETNIAKRYRIAADLIYNEVEIARIKTELSQGVKERVDKNQKEYLLREQLSYIREELGDDNTFSDADQFTEAVNKLKASDEVKEKIRKEIARFKSVASSSSESAVERAYIETLLELPWDKTTRDYQDLAHAQKILERDHFGMEKVKERILEFLAVRSLTKKSSSTIICLVGPPGTGKTSIAKSVAEALHKKYVRICLGGVRDEAEIRGHRKTYVGAMPGRLIQALRQAGVKNPLILLDEIDKVSSDHKGDTASALLEVLDGEQNSHFRDHYVEIPVDLSEVLFIATANSVETIEGPLLDRMEVIEVTSYTANEKFHIAKDHLIPKLYEQNGIKKVQLSISDNALKKMISGYTREAGVRDLERRIGQICRKAARQILQENKKSIRVTEANLEQFLGKVRYRPDHKNETDEVGIVRGLAWTRVGGETLQIEVNKMPGKGEIELTGQLGDVMRESAMAGISYIRSVSSKYHIPADCFKKNDFHIHIPEGAVPKDGPSAGITMATAMLSAITGTPVRADLAMTGEITLRGRVLPIGGLKEKLLAAVTAGITTVLVPKENESDVEEISGEITDGLKIHYVETMDEVIPLAFAKQ